MATTFAEVDAPHASGRTARRAGWVLTGLVGAFMVMDAGMKLAVPELMIANSPPLGWSPDVGTYRMLGAILAVATLLYLVPRTAFLGALLLTAYLGGAVASHLRIGSPLASHTLFGVYLGVMAWGGLWLRDARLRALVPFSTN